MLLIVQVHGTEGCRPQELHERLQGCRQELSLWRELVGDESRPAERGEGWRQGEEIRVPSPPDNERPSRSGALG